jgi:N-glycosidase YbiA
MSDPIEYHGLDTPELICFYEQDYYIFSNFSAFTLVWRGIRFDTSEAAYQWSRFDRLELNPILVRLQKGIRYAPSAHEAFKIAQLNKQHQIPNWNEIKVGVMLNIIREKVRQHEYVRHKLLASGDRELVENSWRDSFWGWGPDRHGVNMLGKIWMQVREELRAGKL